MPIGNARIASTGGASEKLGYLVGVQDMTSYFSNERGGASVPFPPAGAYMRTWITCVLAT